MHRGTYHGTHRGYHVLLDYVIEKLPTHDDFASWLMGVLRTSITDKRINIVHERCELFDGSSSPPGFAAVFLLDESHCSAHCYSDLGMLAIDVFSCGGSAAKKTKGVADDVHAAILGRFDVTRSDRTESLRFPTTDASYR